MNAQPILHPTPEQLAAFGLGKLHETAAAVVAQHLADCKTCRQKLEGLPGDTFLGMVRAAKAPGTISPSTPTPAPKGNTLNPAPAAAPLPELPPELAKHEKYRIVRELGRGGMGVVYQAEHIQMERLVAIKVINKSVLDHPQALERFAQEVRAAAKLTHTNIVAAYDFEKAGELHMLVMEFVEGRNLADVVEQKGPLPILNACHYIRQAALGLQHAFEKGMVHRDLKPQNLMLGPKGVVKLLDMGLARVAGGKTDEAGLTGTGVTLGTPEYIAPEQAMDAAKADIRSDIYSLGCTLYCLLAGQPPFADGTVMHKILGHLEREPQPLQELRLEVPAKLAAVVAQMMAKDPEQRYQKPIEVAQALAPFCKPGAKAVAVEPGPAVPARRTASPTLAASASAMRWESLTEGSATDSASAAKKKAQKAPSGLAGLASKKVWLIGGAAAGVGLLTFIVLIGVVALWAGGAFNKVKAKDNAVVQENKTEDNKKPTPIGDDKEKWGSLFNGKDMAGWVVDSGDQNAWQVKDGDLVALGSEADDRTARLNQGYLLTEREYFDFALRFQFQQVSTKYAWGGVALRAVPHETAANADQGRKGNAELDCPYHLTVVVGQPNPLVAPWVTGSLWWSLGRPICLVPDNLATLKEVGEWNDMAVEMRGQSLRIAVNGRDVQNVMLNKTRPDTFPAPGLSRFSGRIGLMKRVGEVRYRQVEIKELSAEKDLPKKNAARDGFQPGNVWKGTVEQVVDGEIDRLNPVTLTILSRDDKTFSARCDTEGGSGRHYIREFRGTIDGGVVRVLGKDVKTTVVDKDFKVIGVDQGEGPDVDGEVSEDLLEVRMKSDANGKSYSAVGKLQLEKK